MYFKCETCLKDNLLTLQAIEKERQRRLQILKLSTVQFLKHLRENFRRRRDFAILDKKLKQIEGGLVAFESGDFGKIEILILDSKRQTFFPEFNLLLKAVMAGRKEWLKLCKTRALTKRINEKICDYTDK